MHDPLSGIAREVERVLGEVQVHADVLGQDPTVLQRADPSGYRSMVLGWVLELTELLELVDDLRWSGRYVLMDADTLPMEESRDQPTMGASDPGSEAPAGQVRLSPGPPPSV
jgi:hypothetical protein